MTNPIDPTPESNESAAQYRVSAQELSHVVHIIQARKEAEARQRANTVALGDAVEQLGLEMTPDELLAEIQADRARRSGGSRPKRQNNTQHRTFATFAVCAGLAAMMVSSIHMHRLNRQAWENRNNPLYLPRDFVVETTPVPMAPVPDAAPAQTFSSYGQATQFRPFSEYVENERAACDFDSLSAMANGKSQSEIMVQANDIHEDSLWTIEKQDGEVKVYVAGTDVELAKAMNGHAAHLYSSDHSGLQKELVPLHLFRNATQTDAPGMSGADVNTAAHPTEWISSGPEYWTETHDDGNVTLWIAGRVDRAEK